MDDSEFDLEAMLKEGEEALDKFPYDGASWHYESEEYPEDLSEDAAFIHLGMYLCWAIENDLLSDQIIFGCVEEINEFKKRHILPSKVFKLCCKDELTQEHLSEEGNKFTKKYYRPGWKYYYHVDFQKLSGNEISGFYMQETWDNYDRVKETIQKRYEAWLAEQCQ